MLEEKVREQPEGRMNQNYRFVRRDGQLNVRKKGHDRAVWSDAYHALIAMKWRYFLLIIASVYFGIELIFAVLFWLGGDCIQGGTPGSFHDAFFFSVQTLSTIGYGTLSPKTDYADWLVGFEAFSGMLVTAMCTGLFFSKFSRPTARVQFSRNAVIHSFNGKPTLMFRAANMRGNQIIDATVSVSFARFETSPEGERYRRFYDLQMTRKRTAMFILTWTAMHVLDESSPMYGLSEAQWHEGEAELIILISGVDGTFGQTVHARHSYTIDEIHEGMRFLDMLKVQEEEGVLEVDYSKFHEIEALRS